MSIEAWVTGSAGASDYRAHLDRSTASPFRRFAVSRMRGADPGIGSLEYHLDNALLTATPTLLADGNLVWMRYRGRTMVWVIEERRAVLDEGEHDSDWVQVSGRGSKQLLADRLAFPTAFAGGTNLNPATWGTDAQWRRFVNRAAGEMLWDLIAESNARPGFAPITRGTIETTGADGWTQDLRFDNLLDVVADVTATYGEIDMDGLAFSYYNAPGVDRSSTVIFEEGADLLKVERAGSDRDTVSWIVAEGVGEGVTAKLATATDAAVTRRREAYLDAKDAGNLPLVQLRADAAIDELKRKDSIALEVAETRYTALMDYDLHDTIRVIAPSRRIDESAVIVAMYLVESDDERVRVAFDVNTPRQDYLVGLDAGQRSIRQSVGIRNRMPQGQLVPFPISDTTYFDSTTASITGFYIPDQVNIAVRCRVAIDFDQYPMPVSAAASSGSLTSDSGGGSTSGASSSSTSGSTGPNHDHLMFAHVGAPGSGTSRQYVEIGGTFANLTTDVAADLRTGSTPPSHTHGIAHTHSTPDHQHTVPGHTHSLTAAATKEAYPTSHSVVLKIFNLITGTWTQVGSTISGITEDAPDIDLTAYVTGPGRWRLVLQSAGGQPNGGRLGAHLSGYVLGAIQSA